MYQSVGHELIESYAECMGLPLFRTFIDYNEESSDNNNNSGTPEKRDEDCQHTLQYVEPEPEVENLYRLLKKVKVNRIINWGQGKRDLSP